MLRDINLSVSDIDGLIAELTALEKSLDGVCERAVNELSERAKASAELNFANAILTGDNNDIEVTVEGSGSTRIVKATGTQVLFAEFGTGIKYPDDHPEKLGDIVGRGAYGYGQGNNLKGWFYPIENGLGNEPMTEVSYKHPDKIHTYGNPANACMYRAREDAREQLVEVVKGAMK